MAEAQEEEVEDALLKTGFKKIPPNQGTDHFGIVGSRDTTKVSVRSSKVPKPLMEEEGNKLKKNRVRGRNNSWGENNPLNEAQNNGRGRLKN